MRKSYDYGGGPSSGPGGVTNSPRKNSHIYSSAVEILKNNPKKQPQYQASTDKTNPIGSTTQISRPSNLLLEGGKEYPQPKRQGMLGDSN